MLQPNTLNVGTFDLPLYAQSVTRLAKVGGEEHAILGYAQGFDARLVHPYWNHVLSSAAQGQIAAVLVQNPPGHEFRWTLNSGMPFTLLDSWEIAPDLTLISGTGYNPRTQRVTAGRWVNIVARGDIRDATKHAAELAAMLVQSGVEPDVKLLIESEYPVLGEDPEITTFFDDKFADYCESPLPLEDYEAN